MKPKSLEDKLQAAGGAVEMARNSQIGPYVYPKVPAEFSNWRDEQVAWRDTCALFDQTHHMTDLYIEGSGVIELLSAVGVNTFAGFQVNKAKQLVVCNPDGYVIGDGILFFLDENRVSLVGLAYKDQPENTRRFLGEGGNPFARIGVDQSGRTGIDFGVYGVPETYVVKPDGTIAYRFVGPLSEESFRQVLLPQIVAASR